MRTPKYLSPTALGIWEKNKEDYYLQYLAEQRPPRFQQTQPMAVGSAFDAYVKAYLFEKLFGKIDERFDFQNIFEEQVEVHNRDWALAAGQHAFDAYRNSGALADLLTELIKSKSEPRFEFTLQAIIEDVPILGKPDVWFVHRSGRPVILDFKVNGFCSNSPKSPARGYLKVRDGYGQTKTANTMHKDCVPMYMQDMLVNVNEFFESIDKSWGLQLCTYAWLMGSNVGDEFIVAIDQLACAPNSVSPDKPYIRIAEHRGTVGEDFQRKAIARYKECWETINSDHIFRDKTKEESAARCSTLDRAHEAYEIGGDFLKEMMGRL